jgi:hypothetical protein
MPTTNPEIEFGNIDYNPNQFTFQQTKADGMYTGRLLMKNEVLRVLSTMNQTKAMTRAIELIKEIEVDIYANDSAR